MIPDERLTAFALNDPSVCGAERAEIELFLANNESARRTVDDTRQLATRLTHGLAAEPVPAGDPKLLAAVAPPKPRAGWHVVAALAASVLAAMGVVAYSASHKLNMSGGVAANKMAEPVDASDYNDAAINKQPRLEGLPIPNAAMRLDLTKTPQPGGIGGIGGGIGGIGGLGAGGGGASGGGIQGGVVLPQSGNPNAPAVAAILPPASPTILAPQTNEAAGIRANNPGNLRPAARGPISPGGKNDGRSMAAEGRGDSYKDQPKDVGAHFGKVADPLSVDPMRAGTGGRYDRFPALEENQFTKVEGLNALSTFGVDVDTASYSIVRKMLNEGQLPPQGAVRLEEMINYFPYRDAPPTGADPFAVTVELAECPWQPKHRLARIGLKAKPIDFNNRPQSNLVFLLDVSGSMAPENRLPLVKQAMKLLVHQLGENDRVAIVVYAGASGLVLDSTPATRKEEIIEALDRLQSGGSTAGAAGLELAYQTATKHFIAEGVNRVVLCTDGDFNVGTTSTDELVKLIEEKRKTNVFFSVFGFGMGNLRDELMVKLAGKGNGNYGYIDTLKEAHKAFVEQLGGTLVTVAKDVKIQVEFNPAKVGAYRLIGYEKRILAAQDFHDDRKDAGEMGAGHVVTALYELAPAGEAVAAAPIDPLRYQNAIAPKGDFKEAFVVKLRHKLPASDVSTLREIPVADINKAYGDASEDFRFAAAVASYAMLLRDSPYKGNATYAAVIELATAAKNWDPGEYRDEFIKLAAKAKQLSGKP